MSTDTTKTFLGVRDTADQRTTTHRLPEDMVEQAVRRVGIVALVIGLAVIAAFPVHAIVLSQLDIDGPAGTIVARALMALASLGMFVVARSRRIPLHLKSDLGLAYEVVGAAAIGTMEVLLCHDLDVPIGSVSTVAIWILLMRMMVPMNAGRAALASLASAATLPASLWLATAAGCEAVNEMTYGGLLKTTFGTALVALLASRVVYRLGTQVSKARDVGAYHLDERLGMGGMGEVWRASHRMLRRPAAVKLIRPEVLGTNDTRRTETTLARFEKEARSTANLGSVHTVQVFDFGRTDSGFFYYVMELLDGLDLERMVTRFGPLCPERVAHLLRQICHSLGDAHEHGLIHRDVKPSNILVCHLGPDADFVKVLDFGLVKDKVAPGEPTLTVDGALTGTPAYLAPELAMGSHQAGAWTDIYMMGCVAYWMLTGHLVFEGKTPLELVSKHLKDPPPPLSDRCEVEVPEPLERLIMDCLEKNPANRPATVLEVARRLDECEFESPWTQQRAAHWWRTHHPTAG